MRAPTTGPALIGREADLQVLTDALSDARRGVSRSVALGGEAGMGKTRLLKEFRAMIAPDVVVLSAECVDLGPLGVPFGPVRSILRQLVVAVGVDAVLAAVGAGLPALIATLPELAERTDGTPLGAEPLHETVAGLLSFFSRDRTIVILLDDAQWADAATLSLLQYLLRTASGDRLLAVLAYRSDETGRAHPLRQILAELDRARAITRRELQPLDDDQVLAFITSLSGREPDHDTVERIAGRSQGIPFYIEELVGIGGDRIPDTLRDVLLARYGRLDKSARAFLRLLAVGGVQVDHETLNRVSETADLDDLARAATDESLLLTTGDGYAFCHALVREAIYAELLPGERQRTHERYAAVLDELGAPASETSFHWFAAHDLPRALATSVAAFDDAITSRAFASAVQLAERALEIWEKVPDAEAQAGRSRTALLADATAAARDAGDRVRGIALADAAIAANLPSDVVSRARLLHIKATMLANDGRLGAMEVYLEALALMGDSDADLELTARIQASLATLYQLQGNMPPSRALLEQALETARRAGSEEIISRVLLDTGWEEAVTGDLASARVHFAGALAHAGDGEAFLRYGTNVSDAFVMIGDYDGALEATERPMARAREMGLERSWGGILSNSADALFGLGRWDEAEEIGRRVLAIGPAGCAIACHYLRTVAMANWRDDTVLAATIARDENDYIQNFISKGDMQDVLPSATTLGELALFEGDLDEAWRHASIAWNLDHEGPTGYVLPVVGLAARVVGEMRRQHRAVPDEAVSNILATFSRMAPISIVPRWRAFVDAELSVADGTGTDIATWRAAVEALGEAMPAHLAAYSRLRLGRAELDAGERASAAVSLRVAAEEGRRIGATWITNRAEEFLSTGGLESSTQHSQGALTAREQQVLDLIADGLSNREIGQRLFISTKTASVHVSAILRKLGATTRTQAAMRAESVRA